MLNRFQFFQFSLQFYSHNLFAGVQGLRLLLVGILYRELRNELNFFREKKYKDTGLCYGPNWNYFTIKEEVEAGTMNEDSHYGRGRSCRLQVLKNLEDFDLQLHTVAEVTKKQEKCHWYDYLFKVKEKEKVENASEGNQGGQEGQIEQQGQDTEQKEKKPDVEGNC